MTRQRLSPTLYGNDHIGATASKYQITMKTLKLLLTICALSLVFATTALAQKAKPLAPYKITAIRILPFNGISGKFDDELKPDETGGYFNDLDKSILVMIEVSGPAGEFSPTRRVAIRVTEGKRVKLVKTGYPGVLNEDGKFYIPVWLDAAMCDQVYITATMTGQTVKSSMKRSLAFMCGE